MMPLVTHASSKITKSKYWHAQRVRSGDDMDGTHTEERERDIQRETLETKET